MDDADIGYLSAVELAQLYRAKKLSPVEVTEAIFRRIDTVDPQVNAMIRTTPDHAMAAAKESEKRLQDGSARLLEGIPVTIKDLHPTKGVQTDSGSWIHQGTIPDVDAPFVTRLQQAGTMMLGKTTSPEFGWKGVSQSPVSGITHNPWKHGLNAGASSSGAAAASAAGYGPLHQGGDGAGSIRMPAHFCGVYGIKPTHGRIPSWPMSNNDLATHLGPLTRTVADSALMIQAMAGPHPWDYTSLEAPPQDYYSQLKASMKGKRIAWSPDLGHARVDPDVAAVVAKAKDAFTEMGAEVIEVTPDWGPVGPTMSRYFWSATFSGRLQYLEEFGDRMDPGFVTMIKSAADFKVPEFMEMRVKRFAYGAAIHDFFEEWDFLLTPSVSVAAFPADKLMPAHWPQHEWDWLSWAEFSYPFNWSGNPAASVPAGFTPDGLPVGLQIVGKRFDDLGVLQASAAFEEARPWADKRPPL